MWDTLSVCASCVCVLVCGCVSVCNSSHPALPLCAALCASPSVSYGCGRWRSIRRNGWNGAPSHQWIIRYSTQDTTLLHFITVLFINSSKTHIILHVFCISGSGDMDSLPKVRKTCHISICSSVLLLHFALFWLWHLPPPRTHLVT